MHLKCPCLVTRDELLQHNMCTLITKTKLLTPFLTSFISTIPVHHVVHMYFFMIFCSCPFLITPKTHIHSCGEIMGLCWHKKYNKTIFSKTFILEILVIFSQCFCLNFNIFIQSVVTDKIIFIDKMFGFWNLDTFSQRIFFFFAKNIWFKVGQDVVITMRLLLSYGVVYKFIRNVFIRVILSKILCEIVWNSDFFVRIFMSEGLI